MLLENLLRTEDGADITADDIRALAGWDADADPDKEIQFTPARVIMQDFTGVPCVVDLATMREAMADLGGDPSKINPLAPAEMVIDHSVIADVFGTPEAFERNVEIEYERNRERYQFLRWGQGAFDGGYIYFVDSKRPANTSLDGEPARTKVFTVEADKVNEIRLTAKGQTSLLRKTDAGWQMIEPTQVEADPPEAIGLTQAIANLESVREVVENPSDS